MGRLSHRAKVDLVNPRLLVLPLYFTATGSDASLRKGWHMDVPGAIPYPMSLIPPTSLGKKPPVWSAAPSYPITEGTDSLANAVNVSVPGGGSPLITLAWVSGTVGGVFTTTKPSWITFSAPAATPTISFQNHVDANDVTSMVLSATANGQTVTSESAGLGTITVSAAGTAPSGAVLSFFDIPSLADERATYDLLGWTRTASDEDFNFIDVGAPNPDIHGDTEADDLWTWQAQLQRGYTAPIATTFRNRWLTYFRDGGYRTHLPLAYNPADGSGGDFKGITNADPLCHLYGPGLCYYGFTSNDATSIAEAEAIADLSIPNKFNGIDPAYYPSASGQNMGVGGGRQMARVGQLVAHLAYVTGKAKWLGWLNAMTDAYMGASTWSDTTSGLGIVAGGAYFCDRNWMDNNGQQGWTAYEAGARSNSTYQYGMHAEFLWRAYLITGRADVRDRLIQFARFMEHYAHNPANTIAGGPFCSSYFGITVGGGYWHRDIPGSALYDGSIINILVWGHKLTGDANLLARARIHLDKCNRWQEGRPGAALEAPLVPSGTVYSFIDTRRNQSGSPYFTNNKGQLQYVYQVFENGGQPTTIDSGVPAYIRNLSAGSAASINSRVSDVFVNFTGEVGADIGVFAYSGGCYDTRRGRFMISGGGHNNHNGNGVYGIQLYNPSGVASEAPTWQLFKPHTSPPSVTSFSLPSVETAPNGDPAASHTYNQIVYDAYADKLVLVGLGSAAGSTGSNFSRLRLLNLTTNAWDTISDSLLGSSQSMYAAAYAYHDVERAIYGRGGGASGRWHRYDSVTGVLTQLTLSGTGGATQSIDSACAIHPAKNYGIWIGGYSSFGPLTDNSADMVLLDFASRSGSSVTSYARTLTGFPAALREPKLALEFHPPSGTFVAWAGGTTVYRLIPPSNPFTGTWTFSTVTVAGLPTPGSGDHGQPYGRFRWAPYPHDKSRGVFVMTVALGGTGNWSAGLVHVYKPNF